MMNGSFSQARDLGDSAMCEQEAPRPPDRERRKQLLALAMKLADVMDEHKLNHREYRTVMNMLDLMKGP